MAVRTFNSFKEAEAAFNPADRHKLVQTFAAYTEHFLDVFAPGYAPSMRGDVNHVTLELFRQTLEIDLDAALTIRDRLVDPGLHCTVKFSVKRGLVVTINANVRVDKVIEPSTDTRDESLGDVVRKSKKRRGIFNIF